MFIFFDWMLAVHRIVWFPLNWTLGLERPGIELPVEFAPHIAAGQVNPDAPELRDVQPGKRRTRAAASW